MRFHLLPGDTVLVGLEEQNGTALAATRATIGRITCADERALCITLFDRALLQAAALEQAAQFQVRKITTSGILEFTAAGRLREDEGRLQLSGTLDGSHRLLQRRESCRVELRTPARFRASSLAPGAQPQWVATELRDISLSGAALLPSDKARLEIGEQIVLEFTLNGEEFSIPAAVVRACEEGCAEALRGIAYLELNWRQQDRLARAIIHQQLRHISTRVNPE